MSVINRFISYKIISLVSSFPYTGFSKTLSSYYERYRPPGFLVDLNEKTDQLFLEWVSGSAYVEEPKGYGSTQYLPKSLRMGQHTDSDMSVTIKADFQKTHDILRKIKEELSGQECFSHVKIIEHIPFDLIKCKIKGRDFDITFDNDKGIHNSNVLKTLSCLYPQEFMCISIIVDFTKRFGVNGGKYPNSFCFVMIFIIFLQENNRLGPLNKLSEMKGGSEPGFDEQQSQEFDWNKIACDFIEFFEFMKGFLEEIKEFTYDPNKNEKKRRDPIESASTVSILDPSNKPVWPRIGPIKPKVKTFFSNYDQLFSLNHSLRELVDRSKYLKISQERNHHVTELKCTLFKLKRSCQYKVFPVSFVKQGLINQTLSKAIFKCLQKNKIIFEGSIDLNVSSIREIEEDYDKQEGCGQKLNSLVDQLIIELRENEKEYSSLLPQLESLKGLIIEHIYCVLSNSLKKKKEISYDLLFLFISKEHEHAKKGILNAFKLDRESGQKFPFLNKSQNTFVPASGNDIREMGWKRKRVSVVSPCSFERPLITFFSTEVQECIAQNDELKASLDWRSDIMVSGENLVSAVENSGAII